MIKNFVLISVNNSKVYSKHNKIKTAVLKCSGSTISMEHSPLLNSRKTILKNYI